MYLIIDADKTSLYNSIKLTNIKNLNPFWTQYDHFRLRLYKEKIGFDKIILFNSKSERLRLAESNQNNYVNEGYNTKLVTKDRDLLKHTIIIELLDYSNTASERSIGNVDYIKIRKALDLHEIVFISEWLSPELIKVLSNLKGTKGYRLSRFNSDFVHQLGIKPIVDLQEHFSLYSEFCKNLDSSLLSPNYIPKSFMEIFAVGKTEANDKGIKRGSLYENFKDFIEGKQNRILLECGDIYLCNKFISEAKNEIGKLEFHDCTHGSFKIGLLAVNIVFMNIDMLHPEKLNKLLKTLSTKKYRNKQIIIHSKSKINDLLISDYKKISIPTYAQCYNLTNLFFALMAKEKEFFESDHKYLSMIDLNRLVRITAFNSKLSKVGSFDNLEKILDELKKIPELNYSTNKSDFWFDIVDYIDEKYLDKSLLTKESGTKHGTGYNSELMMEEKYIFNRENHQWNIVFKNGEIELNNQKLTGAFYIHLLISHPNQPFDPSKVIDISSNQIIRDKAGYRIEYDLNISESYAKNSSSKSKMIVIDEKDLQIYRNTKKSLENNIEVMEDKNSPRYYKAKEELDEIKKHLSSLTTKKGKIRTTKEDQEKAYDSVTKAIKRVIQKFASSPKLSSQSLAAHLDNSIQPSKDFASTIVYIPEITINWITK